MHANDILGILLVAGPVITINALIIMLNAGGSRILRLPRR